MSLVIPSTAIEASEDRAMYNARLTAFHLVEIMEYDKPMVQADQDFVSNNLRTALPRFGEDVVWDAVGRLQRQGVLPEVVSGDALGALPLISEEEWKAKNDRIFENIPLGTPITKAIGDILETRVVEELVGYAKASLLSVKDHIEQSPMGLEGLPVQGLDQLQGAKYILLDHRQDFSSKDLHQIQEALQASEVVAVGILAPSLHQENVAMTQFLVCETGSRPLKSYVMTPESLQSGGRKEALSQSLASGTTRFVSKEADITTSLNQLLQKPMRSMLER